MHYDQLNYSQRGNSVILLIIGFLIISLGLVGAYFYFKSPAKNTSNTFQATNINTDFNVLIVGWDGIQWDLFNACLNKQKATCPDGLPNIKKLSSDGKRLFISVVGNGETQTLPGWPQLLTGYNSGYTKIFDKKNFQPVAPGGTIFEKLEKGLGEDNITTIYVGVRDTIVSSCKGEQLQGRTNLGEEGADTIANNDADKIIDTQGGPWCNMKNAIDIFINDPIGDKGTGDQALDVLEQYKNKRFIMFTLFADADDAGHKKGGASDEYLAGIKSNDMWLGKLLDKLKELGIDKKTYVYVISDHGWDNEPRPSTPTNKQGADDHDNAPFGIFASNDDSIIRPGDRRDLAATVLKKYGVSFGEDKTLNLAAINGYPLDTPLPFSTIPKGGVYIGYAGSPKCVSGTSTISFSKFIQQRDSCLTPQGGKDIVAGFCTNCGNNICEPPENQCNCPIDCK